MKKLLLVASLAVIAALVAPVASASAAESEWKFSGSCTITGTAKFIGGGLPQSPLEPKELGYEFNSEPIAGVEGTECAGTAENTTTHVTEAASGKAKAHVEGKGVLSCAKGESVKGTGKGYLEVNGKKATFAGFEFTSAGTQVVFTIKTAESNAGGTASFASDTTDIRECALGKEPTKLEFSASASGVIG
jgi:hypothetical protein